MSKNKVMGPVEFGRELILSGDLDPLYILLYNSKMKKKQLNRWLLSYWCFYHAGVSCVLSEEKDKHFFDAMLEVAYDTYMYQGMLQSTWPRGTERRHFRGELAFYSIRATRDQFETASEVIEFLLDCDGSSECTSSSATAVMDNALRLAGFGQWVKWKVADMLERVCCEQIEFNETNLQDMFKSSKDGANRVCGFLNSDGRVKGTNVKSPLLVAHRYLIDNLGTLKAPPSFNRRINVQETETIFCKYKSYLNGHYPLGKDTKELKHALEMFPCDTSKHLLAVYDSELQTMPGFRKTK